MRNGQCRGDSIHTNILTKSVPVCPVPARSTGRNLNVNPVPKLNDIDLTGSTRQTTQSTDENQRLSCTYVCSCRSGPRPEMCVMRDMPRRHGHGRRARRHLHLRISIFERAAARPDDFASPLRCVFATSDPRWSPPQIHFCPLHNAQNSLSFGALRRFDWPDGDTGLLARLCDRCCAPRAHGNKLLCSGGVDGDAVVEVGLGGTHFYRHAKPL